MQAKHRRQRQLAIGERGRSLRKLDLSSCISIRGLPKSLGHCTNLITLCLRGCLKLETLPSTLGGCLKLSTLNLEQCVGLVELPPMPERLGSTYPLKLTVDGCYKLARLPDLSKLHENKKLKVDGLPERLRQWETCDFKAWELFKRKFDGDDRPKHVDFSRFTGSGEEGSGEELIPVVHDELQVFDLSNSVNLKTIPPLGKNLEQLFLCACSSLGKLPASLGECSNLEVLDVSGCRQLIDVEKSLISKLVKLKTLIFTGCSILEDLPDDFEPCVELKELNVNNCKALKKLPDSLTKCQNLRVLSIGGCSELNTIPAKLCEMNSAIKVVPDVPMHQGALSGQVLWLLKIGMIKKLVCQSEQAGLSEVAAGEHEAVAGKPKINFDLLVEALQGSKCELEELQLSECDWPEGRSLSELLSAVKTQGEKLRLLSITSMKAAKGHIPGDFFSSCTGLAKVSFNQLPGLTGTLPATIKHLANCHTMNLWGNLDKKSGKGGFSGPLPAELGACTALKQLSLSSNEISGEVPPQLGTLTNLKTLWLDGNILKGQIPNNIWDLPKLNDLKACLSFGAPRKLSLSLGSSRSRGETKALEAYVKNNNLWCTATGASEAAVAAAAAAAAAAAVATAASPPPAGTEPAGAHVKLRARSSHWEEEDVTSGKAGAAPEQLADMLRLGGDTIVHAKRAGGGPWVAKKWW